MSKQQIKQPGIQRLIQSMRDTMRDAPGVGLAAPQVGVPLQIALIEDRPQYHKGANAHEMALRERKPVRFHVIINPEIELLSNRI